MNAIYAAVLVCAVGAMCPAQESRTNNQTLAELLARADRILTASMGDNVAATKEVDAVFAAANRLFKEGLLERSESYFIKGLQLSPWDMDQQMMYAKVLKARGKDEQAKQVSMMVLRSSERQASLEDAAKLAGVPLLQHLIPLPAADSDRPCICFVPIGDVEDWVLQKSGKQLSDKLGLPVYVFPERLALPAPHRSFHDTWIANIKKDIKWDHPFVQSQLKLMRIKEREKQERLLERIHKQLLSSIGFALGVPRPTDPRSARSYPNSLTDHDAKGTWLSPQCIEGFEKALGQPLPERAKKEAREAL